MLAHRDKNRFGESPSKILIRCLDKSDFTEWNDWGNYNNKGHISLNLAELSNVELAGSDLSKINLKMIDLQNVNLAGADLWRANLKGAKLISVAVDRKTFIWGCNFDEQTVFRGGGLSKARIEPRLIEHMRKNIPIY